MATRPMNRMIQHIRRAAMAQDGADMTDGQLLEAFIARKDDETFNALLRRHGPMIMGVCFRVLRNHHDSEDAFQATFLVLARKASSVRPRERVANWLHGVAYRTALKARAMRAKTQTRERQMAQMPEPGAVPKDNWADLQPVLDEELNRLPEIYRLPLLLCDLEGKSIKAATQQLGWPQGTLAGRLARARKMLAKRLMQRGVVLSGAALAATLSEKAAWACVPLSLVDSTTRAAVAIAAGQAAAPSLVSAKVAALMEGAMKAMMLTKLKTVTVTLLMLGMVTSGGGVVARRSAAAQQASAQEDNKPATVKTETLPKPLDEDKLHGEWICRDEINGTIILIFGPDKTVRRIKEDDHDDTGSYSVDWSKNPHHLDLKLIPNQGAMHTIMEFIEPGKLRIEIGGYEPRPKAFTDEFIVLTKKETLPAGSEQAKKDAARNMKIAEFYRSTGKFGSAHFYYQLVGRRYPETDFAEKAKLGLEDLKKHRIVRPDGSEGWEQPKQPEQPQAPPEHFPGATSKGSGPNGTAWSAGPITVILEKGKLHIEPNTKFQLKGVTTEKGNCVRLEWPGGVVEARRMKIESSTQSMAVEGVGGGGFIVDNIQKRVARIGEIILLGNKTTQDSAIREKMQLAPGDIVDDKALRSAEERLAPLKAVITVIENGDNPDVKDIVVRVKEE